MESSSPCSLSSMLQRSLTTFQRREASDQTDSSAPTTENAFSPLSFAEYRLCLQLLDLFSGSERGLCLLEAALAVDEAGKREAALLLYQLSLILSPTPTAFNNIAVLYAEGENPEEEKLALEWLERGLERFPDNSLLLENYALLQEE